MSFSDEDDVPEGGLPEEEVDVSSLYQYQALEQQDDDGSEDVADLPAVDDLMERVLGSGVGRGEGPAGFPRPFGSDLESQLNRLALEEFDKKYAREVGTSSKDPRSLNRELEQILRVLDRLPGEALPKDDWDPFQQRKS
eukprot:TRINITY_DN5228_c0_g2_i4.p1 TRINITY_DN5228_c0_g2~~TRINITY_DN5228_c0_g2_i4.p1  ORF type:complete len:139 (-),score=29.43 TRINITY_DN5228_c0_g2_i4:80-496(-)